MEATARFLLDVHSIRKKFQKDRRPSWLKITTITMVANIGKNLDLQAFSAGLADGVDIGIDSGHTFHWTITPTKFMNQITVGYTDNRSKKSIKLFPNGAIQVAGCSDLIDCARIRDQLNILIKTFNPDGGFISKFDIVMINTNFYMSHRLDLYNKVLEEFSEYNVNFRPDEYSGVIVKIPSQIKGDKDITVSIFASGAVIITGAQRLGMIAAAYDEITRRLSKCIVEDQPNEKRPFSMFGFSMGKLIKAYQKKYAQKVNVDQIWDGGRKMHDHSDQQPALKREAYPEERSRCIRQLQL